MKMIQETAHVAILPSPGMGHFVPMVELAKRLVLEHNLTATIIVPDSGLHGNHEQKPFLESLPTGVNHILLPPPVFDDSEANIRFEMRIAITILRSLPSIRQALKSLITKEKNLAALVVDFFGTAAFDVANEFQVSPYMFCPCSATALSLFMYMPEIDATKKLIHFPGCNLLRYEDFPFPDRQGIGYKWFVDNAKSYNLAEGIMVNTFADLEGGMLKALEDQELHYPPILPIGPLTQRDSINTERGVIGSEYILNWLDCQPAGSILFICLGSFGLLSNAQLQELAYGIEMSEKGFIWVVRSPDPVSLLPQGFMEKTKGRGLLVSNWAPQAQILGHRSTGGFLTHCGWNSVLESIVSAVPMIAWPLYAEQKMNAVMLTEELKIALRPEPEHDNYEDGLVDGVAIANAVNSLMEGEEAKQLRRRVKDLKDAAEMVLCEEGSSTKLMADLTWKWKKRK